MTSEPGPRLVEVVELDVAGRQVQAGEIPGWGSTAGDPDAFQPDAIHDRPRRPLLAPDWWRGWDRLTRYSAAAAVIFAVVALVAGARALTVTAPVRTTQLTRAQVVPAVDALGCPLTRTCASRPVSASLLDIVRASLPDSGILFSTETYDRTSAQIYRRDIVATTPDVTVQVSSQCRPQASAAIAQPFTVFYFPYDGGSAIIVPLGQSSPPGVRFATETLPGPAGCSLTLHVRADLINDILDGEALDFRMRDLARATPLMVTS